MKIETKNETVEIMITGMPVNEYLPVRVTVQTGNKRWQQEQPALHISEAPLLISWLRKMARQTKPCKSKLVFHKPALHFTAEVFKDKTIHLRLRLAGGFKPPFKNSYYYINCKITAQHVRQLAFNFKSGIPATAAPSFHQRIEMSREELNSFIQRNAKTDMERFGPTVKLKKMNAAANYGCT